MATLTLEYDSRDKTAQKILDSLLVSGVFKVKDDAHKAEQIAIHQNMLQAKAMIEDIRANGSAHYQTMDDFLATTGDSLTIKGNNKKVTSFYF